MKISLRLRDEWVGVLGVFALALILRFWQAGVGFWHDEAASLMISGGGLTEVLKNIRGDFHPPIFYWLLAAWLEWAGKSETMIRAPFIIGSTLAVPLTYLLGKKLIGSQQGGFWAMVLLAVNPLHVYYSGELRMYGLACSLTLISWWFFLNLSDDGRRGLVGSLVNTFLATFTFYGIWFSVAAQIVLMVWSKRYRLVLITCLFAAGLLLWWWPVLKIQLSGGDFISTSLPGWSKLSGDLSLKSILLIPLKMVIGRLNISGDRAVAVSSMAALAYVFFVAAYAAQSRRSGKVVLALGLPLAIAVGISFWVPMLGYWRFVYLTPFLSVLLAMGTGSMSKTSARLNFGALFVIFLFCNITYLMTPSYWREDWKGAGMFFRSMSDKKAVAIYTFFEAFPAAKWYLGYLPSEAILGEVRSSREVMDRRMTEIVSGKEVVLVFEYLNDLADPQRSAQGWLDKAGFVRSGEYSFRGIGQVVEYLPSKR